MTSPVSVPASSQRALHWAGVITVLVGLLGMHGLSGQGGVLGGGHGAEGMSMPTGPPVLVASPSMSNDAFEVAPVPTSIVPAAGLSTGHAATGLLKDVTGTGHDTDNTRMAMGAMCLAILGAVLLALLRLLRRARVTAVVWALPRPVRAILPRGRDPDPPCLIRLSIQRC